MALQGEDWEGAARRQWIPLRRPCCGALTAPRGSGIGASCEERRGNVTCQVSLSSQPVRSHTTNHNQCWPTDGGRWRLTYQRFGGLLKRQLYQFIIVLHHVKVLKWTFAVSNEVCSVNWTRTFAASRPWMA